MRTLMLLLIRAYQYGVRPFIGANCRFYPSCSCYAHSAVSRYGAVRGSRLAVQRLLKCHPWNPGGYDPVPNPPSPTHSGHTFHG